MKIQPNLVYSKNEVSELLNIHPRKLNRIAQRHNIEKVDNRYIFSGSFLIEYFKIDVSKGVQSVSKSVQTLSKDFQEIPTAAPPQETTLETLKKQIESYTIAEIEDIDFKLKNKGELSNTGNLVFVAKGKVYAEYTESEYEFAEQKLNEWRFQQKEIERQAAEITEVKATSTERVEHYKNLFEYQRKQSDRILQIHEKLVGSLNELTKANVQRNIIEAKDKDVINENWKPT